MRKHRLSELLGSLSLSLLAVTTGTLFTSLANAQESDAQTLKIQNRFNTSETEQKNLESWRPENFTDPSNHHSDGFRYIYHELSAWSWSQGADESTWTYKLLKDPSLLENNSKISASLIFPGHLEVFSGRIGFVLEVPAENFVGTFLSDAGTKQLKDYSAESLNYLQWTADRSSGTILDLDDFEMKSESHGYSELVIIGHTESTRVKAKAIVVRCGRNVNFMKLNDSQFERTLGECFMRDNLHLIPLVAALRDSGLPVIGLPLH